MSDDIPIDLNPLFARPGEAAPADRFRIPDCEMLPATAHQVVHDEVMLDRNARLNLATFVGLSRALAVDLLDDIRSQVAYLDRLKSPMPDAGPANAFHH